MLVLFCLALWSPIEEKREFVAMLAGCTYNGIQVYLNRRFTTHPLAQWAARLVAYQKGREFEHQPGHILSWRLIMK